jgi:hypothetical protein
MLSARHGKKSCVVKREAPIIKFVTIMSIIIASSKGHPPHDSPPLHRQRGRLADEGGGEAEARRVGEEGASGQGPDDGGSCREVLVRLLTQYSFRS